MNDTNSNAKHQYDMSETKSPVFAHLDDWLDTILRQREQRVADTSEDLYLDMRKSIIAEFLEYKNTSDANDFSDLLSNVLVALERIFQEHKKYWILPKEEDEVKFTSGYGKVF